MLYVFKANKKLNWIEEEWECIEEEWKFIVELSERIWEEWKRIEEQLEYIGGEECIEEEEWIDYIS